ncbi:hypothetical protein ACFWWA_34560 [Streptomyces goshikiensis]|uniref:hypothetical protein n=1 Tax=Streptomyces goshikiensis TaxID=1942 RepID=UPI00364B8E90
MLIEMTGRSADDQEFYWGIEIPGLTQRQADELLSIVRDSGMGLEPILVNPATFLTLHIDRATAKALMAGLISAEPNPIVDGVRESVDDWLDSAGEDSRS